MRYVILNRLLASGGRWMIDLTRWLGEINSELANRWKEKFTVSLGLLSTMTPPPDVNYVTWEQFHLYLSGIGTALAAVFGMSVRGLFIRSMLEAHFKKDDERFEQMEKRDEALEKRADLRFNELSTRLELEHAENKAALQTLRADMLQSNSNLSEEFRAMRRFFEEYLLKRVGA